MSAFARDASLGDIKGWVADSGEGRWTVQEAIDLDVPAPVITLSLLDALPLASDRLVRREGDRGAAQRVRRPRGEALMSGRRPGRLRRRPTGADARTVTRARSRRPVHDGDLRRARRPQSAQAAAGDLSTDEGASRRRPDFAVLGVGRDDDADRRHLPRAHAQGARRVGRGERASTTRCGRSSAGGCSSSRPT